MQALVIGGTGPTGHYIVNGLLARSFKVAILHTGRHEVDEIPDAVEHIHTDPFDEAALAAALAGRAFDVVVATYGRLRLISRLLVGRAGHLLAVGGVPIYRGYSQPDSYFPVGLPVPTAEAAETISVEADDPKGFRVRVAEEQLFRDHPGATYFRYPFVYGRYQYAPKEWTIVRRILDGRPFIIVADGGLTLNHSGYAENLAHALLLAVDNSAVAGGQSYNCGDERVLSIRQQIDICADELCHAWDVVSMPYELAIPSRPLVASPFSTHKVFDLGKIKAELGYRDVVDPVEAMRRTARTLSENPLEYGGPAEQALRDPFDYKAEDQLVAAWRRLVSAMPLVAFKSEPWFIGYDNDARIKARKA